jgi:hypothetical protein
MTVTNPIGSALQSQETDEGLFRPPLKRSMAYRDLQTCPSFQGYLTSQPRTQEESRLALNILAKDEQPPSKKLKRHPSMDHSITDLSGINSLERTAFNPSEYLHEWQPDVPLDQRSGAFDYLEAEVLALRYVREYRRECQRYHGKLTRQFFEGNLDFLSEAIRTHRPRLSSQIHCFRGILTDYANIKCSNPHFYHIRVMQIKGRLESLDAGIRQALNVIEMQRNKSVHLSDICVKIDSGQLRGLKLLNFNGEIQAGISLDHEMTIQFKGVCDFVAKFYMDYYEFVINPYYFYLSKFSSAIASLRKNEKVLLTAQK